MNAREICARCEYFTLIGSPQVTEGIGRCVGYDGHARKEPYFVRWDQTKSVLFGFAPDMQKREQWIAQRRREDAAEACENAPQAHEMVE